MYENHTFFRPIFSCLQSIKYFSTSHHMYSVRAMYYYHYYYYYWQCSISIATRIFSQLLPKKKKRTENKRRKETMPRHSVRNITAIALVNCDAFRVYKRTAASLNTLYIYSKKFNFSSVSQQSGIRISSTRFQIGHHLNSNCKTDKFRKKCSRSYKCLQNKYVNNLQIAAPSH